MLHNFDFRHVHMSENGWTNNDISYTWLTELFKPQTCLLMRGTHYLLLYNGHSSYILSKFIRYAILKDIILLCLSSHITHKL